MFLHDTIHERQFGGNYLINIIRILQWPKRYLYDCQFKRYGKGLKNKLLFFYLTDWILLSLDCFILKLKQFKHFFTIIKINKIGKTYRDDEWRKPYIWHFDISVYWDYLSVRHNEHGLYWVLPLRLKSYFETTAILTYRISWKKESNRLKCTVVCSGLQHKLEKAEISR